MPRVCTNKAQANSVYAVLSTHVRLLSPRSWEMGKYPQLLGIGVYATLATCLPLWTLTGRCQVDEGGLHRVAVVKSCNPLLDRSVRVSQGTGSG